MNDLQKALGTFKSALFRALKVPQIVDWLSKRI